MPRPSSKYYRVPPATSPTSPVPFQSFWAQDMRQLPYTMQSGAFPAASCPLITVTIRPNEWADGKRLIIELGVGVTVFFPGPPIGLKFQDTMLVDGLFNLAFNPLTGNSLNPVGPAYSTVYLTYTAFRVGGTIYAAMHNYAYPTIQGSYSIGLADTLIDVVGGAAPLDFSIAHTIAPTILANMAPTNVGVDIVSARALIEGPVNIGRAPL